MRFWGLLRVFTLICTEVQTSECGNDGGYPNSRYGTKMKGEEARKYDRQGFAIIEKKGVPSYTLVECY